MDDNNKLIKRIKDGDNEAFDELLLNNKKLIYSLIYSFDLQCGDYVIDEDDLFQEGCLALYEAVFTYEDRRDTKFSSYAYILIRSKLANYITRYYRIYNKECLSINEMSNIDRYCRNAVSDVPFIYHQQNELKSHLGKFLKTLSLEDRMIIDMRKNDYSYKEISDRLKINTKKIDNRLATIRKDLKFHLDH